MWNVRSIKLILIVFFYLPYYTFSKSPPITVMIHGTSRTTNFFKRIPPIHRILSEWLRTPHGFHHISSLSKTHNFVQIAKTLHQSDPEMFDLDHFYFFGWQGYLCPMERMSAGYDAYNFISQLTDKECYKDSPITIITHSHGGNVGLCLAHYLATLGEKFTVKRFILLACPIQDSTEMYAKSPAFKHVHSFFSPTDWLQILDPQGLQQPTYSEVFKTTFFSRRTFKTSLPVNNIKILNYKKGLGHVSFIKPSFYTTLPFIIKELESNTLPGQIQALGPKLYQADLAKLKKTISKKDL